jgi:hypothetical protein
MDVPPQSVRATLWSYDVAALDQDRDQGLIITAVLNHGTEEAVRWVRDTYAPDDIAKVVALPQPGMWDKRSLNLWSLIYEVTPDVRARF